ncbi:MAG: class I SAM-dependent methyltransferase [Anaerolineae bacterium]|nr:class I SAM-dependent methyltransferase [Anaerolineae bacterium]
MQPCITREEVDVNLLDIVHRQYNPEPWSEGEKIPWNDPGFSERMLKQHLDQEHDAASRRFETIDRHVDWIHKTVLKTKPVKVLDLGCGPGLYARRLAGLGHECVGIDFSPASIAYAKEDADANKFSCTYFHQDIRAADYGTGYGLAMLIFGEFNVFSAYDAKKILGKAHHALNNGGLLLLEPHTFEYVRQIGEGPSGWYSSDGGLFSERPHLCLMESFWDNESSVAIERYFIVDAATGGVTRHSSSMQAYTDEGYRELLAECGFVDVLFYDSLGGSEGKALADLFAIVARKQ